VKTGAFILLCCTAVLTLAGTRAYGLAESTGPGGANAQAVHDLGQIGAGINIGLVAARNVSAGHEAFFDKDANGAPTGTTNAFNYDFSYSGVSTFVHDTWMAGIAISRGGVLHPNDIGMAPGADLYCARVINDSNSMSYSWLENALTSLIDTHGCRVIMTGFAIDGVDPNGQSIFPLMYDYYAYSRDVFFANPAGNGGSVIQVFGDAYNGLTVGGAITAGDDVYDRVGSASGSGPTSDGRDKPDVVAPSNMLTVPHSDANVWAVPPFNDGATSLSTPHTAGLAALLLGLADSTAEPNDGHNEVIRAVIVNSTRENILAKSGASTNPVDPNNVWQADRGFGEIDALRAYEMLDANRVSAGATTSQDKGWAYETMTNKNQVDHYYVTALKNDRLVLTVTWNRAVTKYGSLVYVDETSPKFRVDLAVRDSNGVTLGSDSNSLNNLKKIEVMLPRDDTYEIVLTNPGTKRDRSYGMAFELVAPLAGDFNLDYAVDNKDLGVLTNDWLQSGSPADATGDGSVNFRDFAIFAANRGSENPLYH
jgi:hypothetical protein